MEFICNHIIRCYTVDIGYMVDEETKQQVIEIIKDRTFFRSKNVAKKLNIDRKSVV